MFWTRVRLPSSPPSLTADLYWLTAQFDIIKNICYNIYREVRKNMITISKQDFLTMFEGFEAICSEYSGAKVVEEQYAPVLNKYYDLYKQLKEENK